MVWIPQDVFLKMVDFIERVSRMYVNKGCECETCKLSSMAKEILKLNVRKGVGE